MKKVKRMFVTLLMCGLMVGLFTMVSFAASEVEENDYFDIAQSVLPNDFVTGNLATSDDIDCYRFTVPSDGYISLTFSHDYIEYSRNYPYWYVTLYEVDEQEMTEKAMALYNIYGGTTRNEYNSIGVAAGTYYIEVSSGHNASSDLPYEFMLSYTKSSAWETELNDVFETADQIYANNMVNGNLMSVNDIDFYKISLSSAGYISLKFNHVYVNTYCYVTLYDANQQGLAQYQSLDSESVDSDPIGVPAGTYYIKVSIGPFYQQDVPYELTVNFTQSDAWETESNNSVDTADLISVNTSINGRVMTSSDVDYYKVSLSSAGYISLIFNPDNANKDYACWYVTLYNADQKELTQYEFNGSITHNMCNPIGVPAGTYYAKVSEGYAYSNVPYELKLNFTQSGAWETELNDTIYTADPISGNVPINGSTMSSTDVDYYKITFHSAGDISLIFNHDYIDLDGDFWNASIYSEDMEEIAKYSFEGYQPETECEPIGVHAGTYYIKVTIDKENYYYSDGKYELMIASSVASVSVSGVRIDQTSVTLQEGETTDLTATVLPADASDPSVSWKSSDPSVATVSSNGRVSAVAAGTATITVTTSDGGYTAKCTVVVGKQSVQSPTAFQDVSAGAYYYDAVLWAVEQGITDGTSTTTFSPLQSCTRAQVVTFLWRAAGSPKPVSSNNPFQDIKSSDWYYDAVLWAVEQGVTDGTSATTFSPLQNCTRAQVVTFLWRANGEPEVRTDVGEFSDVSMDQYYSEPVFWAVEHGITDGVGNGRFAPMDICNRAQVVTFLYRYDAEG
jgi:hypothetical protein